MVAFSSREQAPTATVPTLICKAAKGQWLRALLRPFGLLLPRVTAYLIEDLEDVLTTCPLTICCAGPGAPELHHQATKWIIRPTTFAIGRKMLHVHFRLSALFPHDPLVSCTHPPI